MAQKMAWPNCTSIAEVHHFSVFTLRKEIQKSVISTGIKLLKNDRILKYALYLPSKTSLRKETSVYRINNYTGSGNKKDYCPGPI
jgi:hypothetical protein